MDQPFNYWQNKNDISFRQSISKPKSAATQKSGAVLLFVFHKHTPLIYAEKYFVDTVANNLYFYFPSTGHILARRIMLQWPALLAVEYVVSLQRNGIMTNVICSRKSISEPNSAVLQRSRAVRDSCLRKHSQFKITRKLFRRYSRKSFVILFPSYM